MAKKKIETEIEEFEKFEILEVVLPIKALRIEIKFPIYPLQENEFKEILFVINDSKTNRKQLSNSKEENVFTEDDIKDVKQMFGFLDGCLMKDCLNAFHAGLINNDGHDLIKRFKNDYYDPFNKMQSVKAFSEICFLSSTEAETIIEYYMSYISEKGKRTTELNKAHEKERKDLEREKLDPEERVIQRADLNVKHTNELAELESELKEKYQIK
jgi:hypothetical protein